MNLKYLQNGYSFLLLPLQMSEVGGEGVGREAGSIPVAGSVAKQRIEILVP